MKYTIPLLLLAVFWTASMMAQPPYTYVQDLPDKLQPIDPPPTNECADCATEICDCPEDYQATPRELLCEPNAFSCTLQYETTCINDCGSDASSIDCHAFAKYHVLNWGSNFGFTATNISCSKMSAAMSHPNNVDIRSLPGYLWVPLHHSHEQYAMMATNGGHSAVRLFNECPMWQSKFQVGGYQTQRHNLDHCHYGVLTPYTRVYNPFSGAPSSMSSVDSEVFTLNAAIFDAINVLDVQWYSVAPSGAETVYASGSSITFHPSDLTLNGNVTLGVRARDRCSSSSTWTEIATHSIEVCNQSGLQGSITYLDGNQTVTKPLGTYNSVKGTWIDIDFNNCNCAFTWSVNNPPAQFGFPNTTGPSNTLYLNGTSAVGTLVQANCSGNVLQRSLTFQISNWFGGSTFAARYGQTPVGGRVFVFAADGRPVASLPDDTPLQEADFGPAGVYFLVHEVWGTQRYVHPAGAGLR